MEWKEVRLGDVCEIKGGKRLPKGVNLITQRNSHPYIRVRDLGKSKTIELNSSYEYVDEITQKQIQRYITQKGDILISIVGTIGLIAIVGDSLNGANLTENCVKLVKLDNIDSEYLYYYLKSPFGQQNISRGTVGAVQAKLPIKNIQEFSINCPKLVSDQRRIASILSSLDRKIELNNKINADLEEMAQAIFKNWFVDFEPFKGGKFVDSELGMIPEGWKVGRADDFYQINIGKTPPRKENKWFSTNPADKIWVSIANMGNSGIFISDSSEYLTKEAVDRHNIIMVPRNTILLSFKLTVGRVAIADKELTTNEAIARFILSDDKYMEYLYLYLKNFDYNSLGSTSSIATAVNSKTIKGMQMLQPSDKIIDAFHIQVNPIFEKIRSLTKENSRLSLLRDTLLPRLMSGELEVPE
ncbi:MAG: restriction endonuclease subunit S [Segatella copri]